jgi:glycosyltransferase involved in cell wall biosynthesis
MKALILYKDNQIHIERFALALRKDNHEVALIEINDLISCSEVDLELSNCDVCIICPITVLPANIEKRLPKNRIYISMAYDVLFSIKVMEKNQKNILLKQLEKSRAFVCDSVHIENEISLLVDDPKAIFKIPYGIEIDDLPKHSMQTKFSNGIIEIAALRNWEVVHNQSGILDAFERLVEKYANIRLHIAGQGPEKVREAQRIERLVERSVLIDHGGLTNLEIREVLESTHMYISNAKVDGTSVTLLEAMYLKCLCLVPDIPSNKEWIKNGENGFVFESLEETLEKSINLFETSDFVLRITQKAHQVVVERANWEQNSRNLVRFISDQCHA